MRIAAFVILAVLAAAVAFHFFRPGRPQRTDIAVVTRAAPAAPGFDRATSPVVKPAAPPPGPIHFTEVTAGSGVDFVHLSGDSAEKPFPAANGSGVAAFDFDLDGRVDLYFLTGTPFPIDPARAGPTNRCYRNLGDWRFQDVTDSSGLGDRGYSAGVAVGDFDSDGFPDVFINSFGPHRFYRNAGDGTFSEIAERVGLNADGWGTSAAFLDYDHDGFLDLYVCHYAVWSLASNQFCGDRARGVRIFCNPTTVDPAPHLLFHNEGDGRFQDATLAAGVGNVRGRGQGVVAADVNADGLTDLYVTNDLDPNFLFLNAGGGRFVERGQESGTATDFMGRVQAGMGVDAADLDRDGLIDLFVTNYEGEHNAFYRNLGGDLFQEVSRSSGLAAESIPWIGWGTALVDFDLDGWLDVVVTNGHTDNNLREMGRDSPYAEPPGLWRNIKGRCHYVGGAAAGSYFAASHVGRGLAVADLDDDGDPDLIVIHQDGAPALLRNDCPVTPERTRIAIRLIGTSSNRSSIGAELTLSTAAGGVVTKQVNGGGSYLSASELRVFFTIEAAAEGAKLQIRWPSGKRTQIGLDRPQETVNLIER